MGQIEGTPAPEIFQNKPYSRATDIWDLGIVLFEMLTFQKPFNYMSIFNKDYEKIQLSSLDNIDSPFFKRLLS